ncbi:MAG: hypothetical protein ACI8S7_001352, partial [Candidatus Krumholzibacteriia bacterium]
CSIRQPLRSFENLSMAQPKDGLEPGRMNDG